VSFGAREKVLKERVKESGCDFEALQALQNQKEECHHEERRMCVRERE